MDENLPKLEDSQFEITAFTCTYNRADTLTRTYASLCSQTVRNFEWIVYDNGSTDNTAELLKTWKQEADFPITLLGRPDNSGFQRSFNHGINAARGFFWLLLDSDDEVVPEAFETMMEIWRSIPDDQQAQFTGVTVNCIDQNGDFVGTPFPHNPTDSNSLEIFYKHKVRAEKFGMNRVDVLKQYPFPDVDDHVNPGVVWSAIAQKYKTRFANEQLRIYYIEEEGRPDQLSFHTALSNNAFGRRMSHQHSLNNNIEWFKHDPLQFIKHAVVYNVCSKKLAINASNTIKDIKPTLGKFLVLLTYPVALAAFFMEDRKNVKLSQATT